MSKCPSRREPAPAPRTEPGPVLDVAAVVAHYTRVAPLLERSLEGIPLVPCVAAHDAGGVRSARAPQVDDRDVAPLPWRAPLQRRDDIEIQLAGTTLRCVSLSADGLVWRAHAGAVEFRSWLPCPGRPDRCAFGRITLRVGRAADHPLLRFAGQTVRNELARWGLDAIPLLEADGITLWVPLAGAPAFGQVRTVLSAIVAAAQRDHPALLVAAAPPPGDDPAATEAPAMRAGCVAVDASCNAVDRWNRLPYTLGAVVELPVTTPITWAELGELRPGAINVRNLRVRLARAHDVFADELARVRARVLPDLSRLTR